MALYHDLQEKINKLNKEDIFKTICKNIKKYRLEKYNEFKSTNINDTLNP